MKTRATLTILVLGAALLLPGLAAAQIDPPHIMVLFDTSGSMLFTLDGTHTAGDGSYTPSPVYPWGASCCSGRDIDGDGIRDGNRSRMYIAKDALRDAIWSVDEGELVFGLARYDQTEYPGWTHCNRQTYSYYCDDTTGGAGRCSDTNWGCREDRISYHGTTCSNAASDSGDILVPYDPDDLRRDEVLAYIDNYEESTAAGGFVNPELRGIGATPLAGSIITLRNYFRDSIVGNPCENFAIILTDGAQSDECNHRGSPQAAVSLLATQGVTVYVIAFVISDATALATMDDMAENGGTGFARVANNEIELRAAFAEIIEDAIRVESCNNADDDCDGLVDENLHRACSTACGAGQETCSTGTWGGCDAPTPTAEDCNNLDDDCDGSIDEGIADRFCYTACGAGTETCERGHWVGCTAPPVPPEVCDGVDNDCDGSIDESDPLQGLACGTDTGACTTGTWICTGGSLRCSGTNPTTEICDLARADEDCDGQVNEGITHSCSVTNGFGTCTGFETCNSAPAPAPLWINCTAPTPAAEVCDNADNDCDGSVDEGLTQACSTACGPGTRTCTAGVWGACSAPTPTVETCNNLDDDCDGVRDDNVWRACTMGSCSGWQQCTAGVWGACDTGSVAELCNNADDDCDGLIDDGLTRACLTACGAGTETCSAGVWGACSARAPVPETCNNVDDDCDTSVDEGLTRACGTAFCPGEEHCAAGAWVGCTAPAPSAETCDNRDNDCDGSVDEGLTRSCSTACGTGTETCSAGVYRDCTARSPVPETCNNIDDDCDGLVDEGVTRVCAVGSCAGVQSCSAGAWGSCAAVTHDEVCNGLDDDCDGSSDEDLVRVCSSVCGTGSQTCAGGAWTACTAPTPSPEICDNRDNDCNGLIDDGVTRACATACGDGLESCTAGFWGPCSALEPTDEVCDGLDNDCDDEIDEDDPDLGEPCGTDEGVCELGAYVCDGGVLDCFDDIEPTDEVCDLLDNDCDGSVDEGLPLGQACCTDPDGCQGQLGDATAECDCEDLSFEPTASCVVGHFVCQDGELVCEGYGGPAEEVCDCIDNDCDGFIDEGLPDGEECGTDVGICDFGRLRCVECTWTCVGATPPQTEVCDNRDNDCDGEVDEGFELLCPDPEAACVEGQCALPCEASEFPCPPGKYCNEDNYCVSDPCADVVCDDSCERCNQNTGVCQPLCDGMECDDPLVCHCGRCVEDNCYNFPCTDPAETCVAGQCVADPCADTSCPEGRFCRDGECIDVCGPEDICDPETQRCFDGRCVDWPCAGVTCPPGQDCVPETGECTEACRGVSCGRGRVCDPATGECVDDPCLSVADDCPEGTHCEDGTCVYDHGDGDGGPDGGLDGGHQPMWVLGTGGGGCPCSAAAPRPGQSTERTSLALVLAFLGLVAFRRAGSNRR